MDRSVPVHSAHITSTVGSEKLTASPGLLSAHTLVVAAARQQEPLHFTTENTETLPRTAAPNRAKVWPELHRQLSGASGAVGTPGRANPSRIRRIIDGAHVRTSVDVERDGGRNEKVHSSQRGVSGPSHAHLSHAFTAIISSVDVTNAPSKNSRNVIDKLSNRLYSSSDEETRLMILLRRRRQSSSAQTRAASDFSSRLATDAVGDVAIYSPFTPHNPHVASPVNSDSANFIDNDESAENSTPENKIEKVGDQSTVMNNLGRMTTAAYVAGNYTSAAALQLEDDKLTQGKKITAASHQTQSRSNSAPPISGPVLERPSTSAAAITNMDEEPPIPESSTIGSSPVPFAEGQGESGVRLVMTAAVESLVHKMGTPKNKSAWQNVDNGEAADPDFKNLNFSDGQPLNSAELVGTARGQNGNMFADVDGVTLADAGKRVIISLSIPKQYFSLQLINADPLTRSTKKQLTFLYPYV